MWKDLLRMLLDVRATQSSDEDARERSWLERRTPWGRLKAWLYARYVRDVTG